MIWQTVRILRKLTYLIESRQLAKNVNPFVKARICPRMEFCTQLILLIFLSGCCQKLSVRSEYITEASFASYYVGSPDPRRCGVPAGQRLIAEWRIPSGLWHQQKLELDITVRFRDQTEYHHIVSGDRSIGTYVYEIQNAEFCKTGGFLTYKVLLKEDGEVTDCWIHPLWQERINF